DCGGPCLVVRGPLMLRGCFGVSIDLDQHKARRLVRLLQDVETRNARLLHAVAGVFQGGPPERFDVLGFDVNEDVYDDHTVYCKRLQRIDLATRSTSAISLRVFSPYILRISRAV